MTDNENDDQHIDEYLDHLWDEFILTRNPITLGLFLRHGGNYSELLIREAVADALVNGPPSRRGGKDNERDIKVYNAVEKILLEPLFATLEALDEGETPPKWLSVEQAQAEYAVREEVRAETIISQYKRGRRALKELYGYEKKPQAKVK